ncbi:MAG: hypothetical protein QM747_14590 [Nocardioides sp.]
MQTRTVRKAAVAVVLPLALGTLAACGSDSSGTALSPQATTGGQQTTSASGSQVTSADFVKLMQGAASKITTVKVAMTGDASGQKFSMKGDMDLTGDKPAMDMTMDMASSGLSGLSMRLVDGTMYVSLGAMTQGKYVKFDLDDPNNPLGSLSSSLDQLDPAKMIGQMGPDVFQHVRYLGSSPAGKHYRATLITAKAPQIKGLPASATANLPKTMAYDAWMDSQGRFTRFVVSVPKFMKMTAQYSDYGAPVHITAPPASQITSMPGTGSSM